MQARKTILSIAVLAAMSGAAWADNSTVTTTQSGNDNLIEVDQQGATGSTITINQSGNDNVAGKQGSASFPPVKQTAKSSSIAINQINEPCLSGCLPRPLPIVCWASVPTRGNHGY
ncbi:hypothetical protein [Cupriavidus numazuensis]|uniref:Uncharacterized protein n=1 Tax=Cupriavidus numazuensis TaxID=221992 RepID=A0ABM8TLH9_9BURK|nr:hypothetical protein [Cupriavidus numazuensis]CAG2153015.1 hypothetical protein LMG26411_04322 [Cupriavidus numazuensis]